MSYVFYPYLYIWILPFFKKSWISLSNYSSSDSSEWFSSSSWIAPISSYIVIYFWRAGDNWSGLGSAIIPGFLFIGGDGVVTAYG